jgi:hypothetical protein
MKCTSDGSSEKYPRKTHAYPRCALYYTIYLRNRINNNKIIFNILQYRVYLPAPACLPMKVVVGGRWLVSPWSAAEIPSSHTLRALFRDTELSAGPRFGQ